MNTVRYYSDACELDAHVCCVTDWCACPCHVRFQPDDGKLNLHALSNDQVRSLYRDAVLAYHQSGRSERCHAVMRRIYAEALKCGRKQLCIDGARQALLPRAKP